MDGKNILPDSIGAPFVIILNESSKPILDRDKKDISDLVTNFSYKYDEEDDDECDITIETDDETLPDNPALSEDKYIIVQLDEKTDPNKDAYKAGYKAELIT